MRIFRPQPVHKQIRRDLRGALIFAGIAMMVWPMFATGEHHPITATLTVQTLCVSLAGLLLIKLQAEAILCKSR